MLKQLKSDVKTLHDPRTGQYTNLRKFIAREQRRQAVYAEACAMTPTLMDVEVKRAPVAAKPVCRWSEQTFGEYVKRDRQRAINWVAI